MAAPGATILGERGGKRPRLQTHKHLRNGEHVFEVRAIDSRGKADPTPAIYRFSLR